MLIGHIISAIEAFAPAALQEEWDNTGLQTGSRLADCTGAMICVDCTEAVVAEAIERGCNLIVSHHPVLFRGLKRIVGSTPAERVVIEAIRHDIAIYSAHTSLDSTRGGVSYRMARMLGAEVTGVLHAATGRVEQLTVYVPRDKAHIVSTALIDLAEGRCMTYDAELTAAAEPEAGAPEFGSLPEVLRHRPLTAVTATVAAWQRPDVEAALSGMQSTIADLSWQFAGAAAPEGYGLGVTATFPTPLSCSELVARIKQVFGSPVVRVSAASAGAEAISRIALCGGAGGEFIPDARRRGAQAYLTSDTRYHDFTDHGADILLLDIGHHESENCAKQIIYDIISEKFPNFAVYKSLKEKNPIKYL